MGKVNRMDFANKILRMGRKGSEAEGKPEGHGPEDDMRQSGRNMLLYFDFLKRIPSTDKNLKAIGDAVGAGAYHYCDVAIFSTVPSPAKKGEPRIKGLEVYMFDYYVPIAGGGKLRDGAVLAAEKITTLLKGAGISARADMQKSLEFGGDYLDILPLAFKGNGNDAGAAP